MHDSEIVKLYMERSQQALTETENKYGPYCSTIAYNILRNHDDAKECVNDTYYKAWTTIPPAQPNSLSAYLGKITRNLSLNRFNQVHAQKRSSGQIDLALCELEECISSTNTVEDTLDEKAIGTAINNFLVSCGKLDRIVFVRRYWYLNSIKEIADGYQISESKVKSMLFRTRKKLKDYLIQEGIAI